MKTVNLLYALGRCWLVTVCSLVGCAESEVLVGNAPGALDLSTCAGTDCASNAPSAPLASAPATECNPGPSRPVALAWIQHFERGSDCGELGPCSLYSFRMAVAPDSSVWVAAQAESARNDGTTGGVWLAHYGPQGEALRTQLLAVDESADGFGLYYDLHLAIDGRGHVHVAVLRMQISDDGSDPPVVRSWLAELDEQGNAIGARRAISGGRSEALFLSQAGQDAFALAGRELDGRGVALIEGDQGQPRWTQTNVSGTELVALTADAQSEVTVLTRREATAKVAESFSLRRLGPDGTVVWDRLLGSALLMEVLTAGADGSVTRIGLDDSISLTPTLERITAEGESAWVTRVPLSAPTFGQFDAAATGEDGTVYLPGETGLDELTFLRLSPDGASCSTYRASEPFGSQLSALVLGPEGELFFAWQFGFGRFEPVEEEP